MCKPRNVWISVSHVCIIPPSHRLECVMPVVCTCVSVDSRFQTVSQCVSILTSMSDHEALAKKLCSQHGEAAPSAALYLVWSLISFICSTKVLQEASLRTIYLYLIESFHRFQCHVSTSYVSDDDIYCLLLCFYVSLFQLKKSQSYWSFCVKQNKSIAVFILFLLDPCVFLKLFQFIRTRPDNHTAHTNWIQLDLQVVHTHCKGVLTCTVFCLMCVSCIWSQDLCVLWISKLGRRKILFVLVWAPLSPSNNSVAL